MASGSSSNQHMGTNVILLAPGTEEHQSFTSLVTNVDKYTPLHQGTPCNCKQMINIRFYSMYYILQTPGAAPHLVATENVPPLPIPIVEHPGLPCNMK